MKGIVIVFMDQTTLEIICEDYDIVNGCLYLMRVDKVNDKKVPEDKNGKITMIHNMVVVKSMAVTWI